MLGCFGGFLLFFRYVSLAWSATKPVSQPPHIIYILADDMGWNDVSFHGSDQIPTPNIDSLAYNGVILNRHYTQPLCTPSRAALMTGKYPIHIGVHDAYLPSHRAGLPLSEKIMPQYFKEIGYKTHLVGKWHLGFYENQFTPLQRGFDSHYGYWTGAISYYDHVDEDPLPPTPQYSGHDFRRNYTSAYDLVGQYATDLFTKEAVKTIENHPINKPMFMFLAHLAPHAGNQGKWLEAPQEEINKFSYITDPNRRTYAAMVSKLDQSVGAVIRALERRKMLSNSIIVFVSDNGAPSIGLYSNWGSNYPWRGQKGSLWEGGVRTPSVVWSPLIAESSRVSYSLMHITDWLPTLLAAAGSKTELSEIDGINQWPTLSKAYPGPRKELVVDIDVDKEMAAILVDQFKFVRGPNGPGKPNKINGFLNLQSLTSPKQPVMSLDKIISSTAWQILQQYSSDCHTPSKIRNLRQDAIVLCNHDPENLVDCFNETCIFDLQRDPCEQTNLAQTYPLLLSHLQQLLENYKKSSVPSIPLFKDFSSNPNFFNGDWSIWVI